MRLDPGSWRPGSRRVVRFVGTRFLFVLAALAFAAAFCWNYLDFQSVALSWSNIYYASTPLTAWIAGFFFFLVPGLFIDIELVRPSHLALLLQYAMVLMPTCFVPMFRQEMPLSHCILLSASFSGAMLILLLVNKIPRKVLPFRRMPSDIGWWMFAIIYVALNGVVAVIGPHWQIVSFADVYDLVRQQALAFTGSIYAYSYMNLAWVMNPFLLSYAVARKKYWLAAFACIAEVYLYGYGGFKGVVFAPVLVIGSYLLVKNFRQAATKIVLIFLTLVVVTTLAYVRNPSPINMEINSLYDMRTIGMAGQSAAGYDYFAYNHGFTYWSHLKGVNQLVHYDYKDDVGSEVGFMEQGYETQDNTGFLATDGLSALGFAGVLIIAFVVGTYFWLLDCVASGHDRAFAIAACSVPALVLVNEGFFTSLLSAGTFLILLLLQFMPFVRSGEVRFPQPENEYLSAAVAGRKSLEIVS